MSVDSPAQPDFIKRAAPAVPEVLQVRNLAKIYRGASQPAVQGLDFSICPGEVFGLLGPNGAGKTTAILVICALMPPTGGSVTLCGHDVFHSPGSVRKLLGLAPQDLALYPRLTARENLRYFGRLHGLHGQALEARIDVCLDQVGLLENADQRIDQYSGGMKRRANLAAAIVHSPRLLLLDEPTVGIDPQSRNLILKNLTEFRDQGMTILYTTHYMEEAQQLCSRVGVMDSGRIIATGSTHDLLAQHPGCANLEELFLQLTGKHLRD
ncbi:MAG: ABC transporter ATP-binding protein [Candidatus Firestonebacteria bacterium]|nr:ABC transporter ATP-binding protein [Candidatus Firestonebacteria bacterium]